MGMEAVLATVITVAIGVIGAGGSFLVSYLKKLQQKLEETKTEAVATHETIKHNCSLQEERHIAQHAELKELVDALIVKEVKSRVKLIEKTDNNQ